MRWHDQLDGHEVEHTLGLGDEQGSLACCSPWDLKESHMTEQLNQIEQLSVPPSLPCFVLLEMDPGIHLLC